jgi:hypothetical protein
VSKVRVLTSRDVNVEELARKDDDDPLGRDVDAPPAS